MTNASDSGEVVSVRPAGGYQMGCQCRHVRCRAEPIPRAAARCTSTSSPPVRRNTVPLCCSPNTSRSAGVPSLRNPRGQPRRERFPSQGLADPRVALNLDEDLALQNREDLVGSVVAVEVSDVVGCNGLHSHDEMPQTVLRSSDDGDFVGLRRERHLGRRSLELAAAMPTIPTVLT